MFNMAWWSEAVVALAIRRRYGLAVWLLAATNAWSQSYLNAEGSCRRQIPPDRVKVVVGVNVTHARLDSLWILTKAKQEALEAALIEFDRDPQALVPVWTNHFRSTLPESGASVFRSQTQYAFRVHPTDSLRSSLEKLLAVGMNEIKSLSFELSNEDSLKQSCRLDALEVLKSKAKQMASRSGMKLGKLSILSFRELPHAKPESPLVPDGPRSIGGEGGIDDLLSFGGNAGSAGMARGDLNAPSSQWPEISELPEELFRMRPKPISIEQTLHGRFEVIP